METKRIPYPGVIDIVVTDGRDGINVRGAYAVLRPTVSADESLDTDVMRTALIRDGAIAVRSDHRREILPAMAVESVHSLPNPIDALLDRLTQILDGDLLERAQTLARETFGPAYG